MFRTLPAAIATILLLGGAHDARAALVDLGDLQTVIGQPAWGQFQQSLFFDQGGKGTFNTPSGPVTHNGWVSQHGVLDGGEYFFTDLFGSKPTNTSNVWWNFEGSEFWLTFILTYGVNETRGIFEERLYRVGLADAVASWQTITLDDGLELRSISFYGTDPAHVPESGTQLLLALALSLLVSPRWRRRRLIG